VSFGEAGSANVKALRQKKKEKSLGGEEQKEEGRWQGVVEFRSVGVA